MDGITLITKIIVKRLNVNSGVFDIGNQIWKSGSEELNFNDWNK